MELKQTQATGFSILQRLLPRFHHELTLNGDVAVQQQHLLMYPCANYTMSFSQYCSKTTAVRNSKKCSESVHIYSTYMTRPLLVLCFADLHPSSVSRSAVFSKMPGCLENSSLPADRRDSWGDVCFFNSFITFSFSEWRRKSQGRDFDDADSSWARGGLDAWRCGVAQESGRSSLHGPVEAVPVRAQIWGCREADDRRGDPSAFAVDPAAVIQLKV